MIDDFVNFFKLLYSSREILYLQAGESLLQFINILKVQVN